MADAPFLTAEWRDLVMLNFVVDPAVLAPHVPPGTELDLFGGEAFVSVVGFMFLRTRLMGCPVPWHRDFEELNLRFYVRRRGQDGEPHVGADGYKRGVAFVKEIVPRAAVAMVARRLYGERYEAWPMRHTKVPATAAASGAVGYAVRIGGRWHELGLGFRGEPAALVPGSEAEFIAEHYWGYVAGPGRPTIEYRVEHPPWRVWHGEAPQLRADVAALYGREWAAALATPPRSAFLADGSPVTVYHGRRLT
ncbi:YqjF family protein [Nannocystis bainbridge]|uniref:DUF2071 domain-containing protein n=1 Tax=Nannocystis bainbridge TaxID=2995303 RepID=A0ABT5EBD6_9BACT|nr:DUF2071 domain-containing protein [Nannocystis bainbridge]MDC0723175.1 DUF2071 domain-containing protein [Nannocystis bainbridge]